MHLNILFLVLMALSSMAQTQGIPDLSKINKLIQKNTSGTHLEWCATCEELKENEANLSKNFTKLGGDPIALKQALCFYKKYKTTKFKAPGDPEKKNGIQIQNSRYIVINDLVKPSSKPRFYLLDLKTGLVEATFSSHGGGQKILGERDSTKDFIQELSNKSGSNLSARGFFITGARYKSSSPWKFSMKLYGLQSEINDKTFERDIVMHPFVGVEELKLSTQDEVTINEIKASMSMPLSFGCTMLPPKFASEIIEKIKSGSLYFNYTSVEKNYGESYCGDEKLLIK